LSHVILRGRWYDIVLNVRAPTEDKTNNTKDSICEELEHIFNKFSKYHMKTFLDFNVKEAEKIFANPLLGMRLEN
jgi:hypothetical protein